MDKRTAYIEERRRYWDDYAKNQPGWDGPRRYRQRLAELYRFVIPPGGPAFSSSVAGKAICWPLCSLLRAWGWISPLHASNKEGANTHT